MFPYLFKNYTKERRGGKFTAPLKVGKRYIYIKLID